MRLKRFAFWTIAPLAAVLLVAPPFEGAAQAAGAPTIVIDDAVQQLETDGGSGQIAFTVRLTEPSSQPTTVSFATGDDPSGANRATAGSGSCSAGEDFIATSSAVTIPANSQAAPSAQILVTTCGDRSDEFDETFVVNVSNPFPALQIADGQARGTLVDDDAQPSLSLVGATLFERNAGTANATVEARLSAASGKTVTAQPTLTNVTAVGGANCGGAVDFVNAQPAPITFTPGQTTAQIQVPVCGDLSPEANDTFRVGLGNVSNASAPSSPATVTIQDDDTAPVISIGNSSSEEGSPKSGAHSIAFTVTLSRPFGQDVTVRYATRNGTAVSRFCNLTGDYFGVFGTLTVPAYETSAVISVPLCADTVVEPNETFVVELSSPSAGTIGTGRGTGTILNDD
jgi:hypothetical protein